MRDPCCRSARRWFEPNRLHNTRTTYCLCIRIVGNEASYLAAVFLGRLFKLGSVNSRTPSAEVWLDYLQSNLIIGNKRFGVVGLPKKCKTLVRFQPIPTVACPFPSFIYLVSVQGFFSYFITLLKLAYKLGQPLDSANEAF